MQVVQAHDMPLPGWDATRRRFFVQARSPALFPEPLAKAQHMLARLQVIEQRVQRCAAFKPPALATAGSVASMQVCKAMPDATAASLDSFPGGPVAASQAEDIGSITDAQAGDLVA